MASWMSRWLVNFSTVPMMAERIVDVDHARGDLALDPAPHEDELDHLVPAVLHLFQQQVDRGVDLRPVDALLPSATLVAMCSYSSMARRYASRFPCPPGRSRRPATSSAGSGEPG